jgi:hypothetical protein
MDGWVTTERMTDETPHLLLASACIGRSIAAAYAYLVWWRQAVMLAGLRATTIGVDAFHFCVQPPCSMQDRTDCIGEGTVRKGPVRSVSAFSRVIDATA